MISTAGSRQRRRRVTVAGAVTVHVLNAEQRKTDTVPNTIDDLTLRIIVTADMVSRRLSAHQNTGQIADTSAQQGGTTDTGDTLDWAELLRSRSRS